MHVAGTHNHRIQKLLLQQPLSNDVALSSLTVNSRVLIPSFSTAVDTITLNVDNTVASLPVTATTVDALAKLETSGMTAAFGTLIQTVALSLGSTISPIVITAQDGVMKKTYTLTVIRAGSSDATK